MQTGRLILLRCPNSKLEATLGYEIKNDADTALMVPKDFFANLLKPKALPVNLIWEVNFPGIKRVAEPIAVEIRRVAADLKVPRDYESISTEQRLRPHAPYMLIGKETELSKFIKRYNSYKSAKGNYMHTITIIYG